MLVCGLGCPSAASLLLGSRAGAAYVMSNLCSVNVRTGALWKGNDLFLSQANPSPNKDCLTRQWILSHWPTQAHACRLLLGCCPFNQGSCDHLVLFRRVSLHDNCAAANWSSHKWFSTSPCCEHVISIHSKVTPKVCLTITAKHSTITPATEREPCF